MKSFIILTIITWVLMFIKLGTSDIGIVIVSGPLIAAVWVGCYKLFGLDK